MNPIIEERFGFTVMCVFGQSLSVACNCFIHRERTSRGNIICHDPFLLSNTHCDKTIIFSVMDARRSFEMYRSGLNSRGGQIKLVVRFLSAEQS